MLNYYITYIYSYNYQLYIIYIRVLCISWVKLSTGIFHSNYTSNISLNPILFLNTPIWAPKMNRFNTKPAFRRSYFWWQGITGYIDPYPMGTESNSSPCLVANEPTWHECVWKLGNQTPTCGKWQWSFTTKIGDPLVFFKHAHMALRHQWLYPIPALVKTVVESFVDRSGFPAHHVIFALQACDLYWFCQQTFPGCFFCIPFLPFGGAG